MKTLIAIPSMDTVPVDFVNSLMRMEKDRNTVVCFKQNSLIYDSRNLLSLTAIENDYDNVLWLDSDMIVPQETIAMLENDMRIHDCDMVTGLYVTRSTGMKPVIYDVVEPPELMHDGTMRKKIREYENYPENDVFQVKGCGFGCVMTSVDLLRDVWDAFGPAFSPMTWAGEDITFCWRVNELGKKILCDSRVKCGHIGQFIYHPDMRQKRGDE